VQYVNAGFASKHLNLNVPVKLQNSEGEHWEVSCAMHDAKSSSSAMIISRGFTIFQRGNNLLKVTMFRVIDYCD
jgi:hypothetical protein